VNVLEEGGWNLGLARLRGFVSSEECGTISPYLLGPIDIRKVLLTYRSIYMIFQAKREA